MAEHLKGHEKGTVVFPLTAYSVLALGAGWYRKHRRAASSVPACFETHTHTLMLSYVN